MSLSPEGERLAWVEGGAALCVGGWREGADPARAHALPAALEVPHPWIAWTDPEHVLLSDRERAAWLSLGDGSVEAQPGRVILLAEDGRVVLSRARGRGVELVAWTRGAEPEPLAYHRHAHDRWVLDADSLSPVAAVDERERPIWVDEQRVLRVDGGRDRLLLRRTRGVVPGDTEGWLSLSPLARGGELLVQGRLDGVPAAGRLELSSGRITTEWESPGAELRQVLRDPDTQALQAASITEVRDRWIAADPALEAELRRISETGVDFVVLQRSEDDRVWLLHAWSPTGPPHPLVFDRGQGTLRAVGVAADAEPSSGVRAEALTLQARDGLEISAMLLLPPEGEGPPPVIVDVHGGPWGARHDWWGDASARALAERGYAVLQVNFRGSAGFGPAFEQAGEGEFGDALQTDVLDALAYAVAAGWVDGERVAFTGVSFGGYSVLRILTRAPEVGACGVAMAAPGSLTLRRLSNASMYLMAGTPEQRRAWSPLRDVEQLEAPLLMLHGARDRHVPPTYARSFARQAARAGAAVTYLEWRGEDHFFGEEAAARSAQLAEAFLAQCLEMPAQPLPEGLDEARLSRAWGGEHVPGLSEALGTPTAR
ncbi:MAG: S9 family peptidase [Alphaproteobacteria bacterium]|nr:S9 family peptidase [Alphaproteobacteria bacterium]